MRCFRLALTGVYGCLCGIIKGGFLLHGILFVFNLNPVLFPIQTGMCSTPEAFHPTGRELQSTQAISAAPFPYKIYVPLFNSSKGHLTDY